MILQLQTRNSEQKDPVFTGQVLENRDAEEYNTWRDGLPRGPTVLGRRRYQKNANHGGGRSGNCDRCSRKLDHTQYNLDIRSRLITLIQQGRKIQLHSYRNKKPNASTSDLAHRREARCCEMFRGAILTEMDCDTGSTKAPVPGPAPLTEKRKPLQSH